MWKQCFKRKNFVYWGALFIALLFAYITIKTPLTGDDWGYALNGRSGNPFSMALYFYQTWSGRFFSELWGFLVAPHKWIWNIVNPLLFTGIFLTVYTLGNGKEKPIISVLFIIAMMVSVDDDIRMETYSWLMGDTYVIPLCLSLVYFLIADKLFRKDYPDKTLKLFSIFSNCLLFIIGLMMENISATMVIALAVLSVYAYFKKRRICVYFIFGFVVSLFAFVLLRISPGAAYRAAQDTLWSSLSIWEKIVRGYPNFINMTFILNNYTISLFSLAILIHVWMHRPKKKIGAVIISLFQFVAVFSVFSFVIWRENNPLTDPHSLYSLLFWPLYVIACFAAIILYSEDDLYRDKILFMLGFAGCASAVMIYSPIFGARSVLYTMYYLMIVACLLIARSPINIKMHQIALILILLGLIVNRSGKYIHKYNLVAQREIERQEVYQYYREHPEDEEVWIPRYPIYSIHGGDIEPGDDYHFETFVQYYQLPQDPTKIVFYFVEDK